MSKTIVIHHSADFDGLFCREIAKKFMPDARLIGWDYGDPTPGKADLDGTEQLYMLDISISDLMDHPKLIWIDHHKTAMEKFHHGIPGYRIDGVAACRLAWQWFSKNGTDGIHFGFARHTEGVEPHCNFAETLPRKDHFVDRKVEEPLAVRLAGEYDIWDKRDPRAELFQHGLKSQEISDNMWDLMLVNEQHTQFEGTDDVGTIMVRALLDQGKVLEFARKTEYREVITQQGFTLEWEGLRFLACCSHELDIRSHLFEAGIRPDHDALLGFTYSGKDWHVSMYGVPGKPDVDVSVIAKKYGGGGHKQACGFRHNTLPFKLE